MSSTKKIIGVTAAAAREAGREFFRPIIAVVRLFRRSPTPPDVPAGLSPASSHIALNGD